MLIIKNVKIIMADSLVKNSLIILEQCFHFLKTEQILSSLDSQWVDMVPFEMV